MLLAVRPREQKPRKSRPSRSRTRRVFKRELKRKALCKVFEELISDFPSFSCSLALSSAQLCQGTTVGTRVAQPCVSTSHHHTWRNHLTGEEEEEILLHQWIACIVVVASVGKPLVPAVHTAGFCSPVRGRMSGLRVPTLRVRGFSHARRCRGDRDASDRICDHASRVRGTSELSACPSQVLAVAPWRCAFAGNIFHRPLFSTSQH